MHADDLAASVGLATPAFDDDVVHPALALLGMLSGQQHGTVAATRALARSERSASPASAFGPAAGDAGR